MRHFKLSTPHHVCRDRMSPPASGSPSVPLALRLRRWHAALAPLVLLMLGLFLDFLSRQALTADQGPVLYTEAMAADDDELLAGVTVDAAGEQLGA